MDATPIQILGLFLGSGAGVAGVVALVRIGRWIEKLEERAAKLTTLEAELKQRAKNDEKIKTAARELGFIKPLIVKLVTDNHEMRNGFSKFFPRTAVRLGSAPDITPLLNAEAENDDENEPEEED